MGRTCQAPHDRAEPAWGHSRLCAACRAGIRSDLDRISALALDVAAALIPSPAPGAPARSSGAPIPVNLDAAQWLGQVTRDLAVITAWTRDERGTRAQPPRRIPDMAGFLAKHAGWIAYRPWAPDAAGMLTENRRAAQRILWDAHPGARALIPIPHPCPECAAPRLAAHVFKPGDPREPAVRCACCGASWNVLQWHRLGQRLTTRSVTP